MEKTSKLGKAFAREMTRNQISMLASGATFFFFLSLIPILMLLCSILPYTPLSETDFILFIETILPSVISPWMKELIREVYDKSPAVISISAVITLWSASRGILGIMRGMNQVNRVQENRNFILLRMIASLYTIMMLFSILFFLGIMVFGRVLSELLEVHFKEISYVVNFLMRFRFLYAITILTILFMLLYKWIPNKKLKLFPQLPGAVVCSVGWALFSDGYSYYIAGNETFGIYGSLTTIIIGLLWLYVCIYLFLLGAEINIFIRPVLRYYVKKRNAERIEKENHRRGENEN